MTGLFFLCLAVAAIPSVGLPKLGEPVGDAPNWFDAFDWTSSRAGGSVRFKVIFKQDGLPDTCIIQATTGNREVELLACALIKKRFRFRSSLDSDGAPVSRVLVRMVSMGGPAPDAIRPPALFSLTVNGYEKVSRVSVVADVNEDGSLVGCSGMDKKEPQSPLNMAVCNSLKNLWAPLPEVDGNGVAVRYVRDIPVDIKHAP